jgi:hypothetical protein
MNIGILLTIISSACLIDYNNAILFTYNKENKIDSINDYLDKHPKRINRQQRNKDLSYRNYTPLHYACVYQILK